MFNGTDLLLVSVLLGFISAFVLAKGFIFRKPEIREMETATFLGFNPFLFKSGITQEVMTWFSVIFALLGALAVIASSGITFPQKTAFFFSSKYHFMLFILGSFCVTIVIVKLADAIAVIRYMPQLKEKMKESFEQTVFILEHGMDQTQLSRNSPLTEEQKEANRVSSRRNLNHVALLFDLEPPRAETQYPELINRLKGIIVSDKREFLLPSLHIGSAGVQAVATIILVIITYWYVDLTSQLVQKQSDQIKSQDEQFQLMNRAKVNLRGWGVEGDVKGGSIILENQGLLPAENLRVAWKMIVVDGSKIEQMVPPLEKNSYFSPNAEEVVERKSLDPEAVVRIAFTSPLDFAKEPVFLVVAWSYKGQGLMEPMSKTEHYLWLVAPEPKRWVPSSILGAGHISAVNRVKSELVNALSSKGISGSNNPPSVSAS